jgi:hypothetical protein
MSDYSVAVHEASHCAAGWLLGREVDHTWVATGSVQAGETAGFASLPIGDRVEPSQVVICLVGYWSVDTPDWPPSFEDALSEEREALGRVLRYLGATKQKYDATVEFTRELLEDEQFVRLRDAIARALARVPRIERETIERLAAIHFDPDHYEEVAA